MTNQLIRAVAGRLRGIRRSSRTRPADRGTAPQPRPRTLQAHREQPALRAVATLVARGAPEEQVFAVAAEEIRLIVGADACAMARFGRDDSVTTVAARGAVDLCTTAGEHRPPDVIARAVRGTGQATRFDHDGSGSSIGVPIIVDGLTWGMTLVVARRADSLSADAEALTSGLTDVAAIAVGNARTRADLHRVAEEQSALRQVAELVARDATPGDVFAAVVTQTSRLMDVALTTLVRYEPDGSTEVVAVNGALEGVTVGGRADGRGDGAAQRVWRTGRAARIDDLRDAPGHWPQLAHRAGFTSTAAVPIVIQEKVWGALAVVGSHGPLPSGIEERLAKFAELVGTAIASAQARSDSRGLVDEQAALRRLAELVASGAAPQTMLDAAVAEASRLLGDAAVVLMRYDPEEIAVVVAACCSPAPLGMTQPTERVDAIGEVLRTGQARRVDSFEGTLLEGRARELGVAAGVMVPVFVEGRVWGSLSTSSPAEPVPAGVEHRLTQFADVVGAAVSSAQARQELRRVADEQAALRRVAELVARGVPQDELLSSVAAEASQLIEGEATTLMRFDDDGATVLASCGGPAPVGSWWPISPEDDTTPAQVLRTGRPARRDHDTPNLPDYARDLRIGSSVGAPIMVEDRVWGLLAVTTPDRRLPEASELRLQQFTELVATAVANAENRAQLIASRARVLATADETRRRVQRDLHDGAQQRLVQTVVTLRLAKEAMEDAPHPAAELVDESLLHAERATQQLRDIARGMLPASLSRGGLQAGIESLVADLSMPVTVEVSVPRLPGAVEISAFFLISEALTNVVKHARATTVTVFAGMDGDTLTVGVTDDGRGGADPGLGSGLTGLRDRVEAATGRLTVTSPPGHGTTVRAEIAVTRPGSGLRDPGNPDACT